MMMLQRTIRYVLVIANTLVSNSCVNSHNDRVIIDNVGSSSSKLSYDLSNVGHKVNYNINTIIILIYK